MAKRNGYFRLNITEAGIDLQLIPPTEGGNPVVISEVMDYLNLVHISDYDLPAINNAISNLTEKKTVKITDTPISYVGEKAKVKISNDRMVATIRLYPPSNNGKPFTRSDMIGELALAGIKGGIVEKNVDALVATPVFCHDIVVAKGKPVREGSDASIEYHFETKPLAKPKLNEDGTVDFHQLNIFTRVEKNQLLATLTPEDPGEEGMDLFGNRVLPRKVKKAVLKCGRNIRLTEDRLQMFSEVDGDVKLEKDTVFVSDSYTVPADVDTSTGDIEYAGNVIVTGNVRTGFTVRAKGDIQVKGVVEGACLYAGGNIVLARGVQGMNKGILQAEGDIVSKFIESCTVKAGGNVRTGSLLHSNVQAGDSIICDGKKSFAIGGNLSAVNLIDVKTLGNQMGTVTNIKIGIDASVLENLHTLEQELAKNQDTMSKNAQILLLFKKKIASGQQIPADKIALIKSTSGSIKELEERQVELKKQIEEIQEMITANSNGRLKVGDTVYPGARILIGKSMHVVKDARKYCQYRATKGEIVVESC